MTTDQENAADASEFREECRRDQDAEARARSNAMSKRLHSQLAALPPDGGRVRDPETKYIYRAEPNGAIPHLTGWILHPVCRERYVDGDCPFPVHRQGLCNLHHHRYLRKAAGTLECAMDAPKEPEGLAPRLTVRLPLELQLRCNVAAGRAGLERNVSEWMRGALEAACSISEALEQQAKEKPE